MNTGGIHRLNSPLKNYDNFNCAYRKSKEIVFEAVNLDEKSNRTGKNSWFKLPERLKLLNMSVTASVICS
ncbi:unnamed protein product [Anisakis simplex]|uniref:Uncharacterized protein n=1 Tax=Anisakis simplex TaxID=6269 RepID=A0A0M3KCB3_ANISI|nr:unnamed protein product [Anisakis simplex]